MKKLNEKLVTKIVTEAATTFPSFGEGSQPIAGNPIANALKDRKPMFTANVDISAVIRLALIMSGQPELLSALKAAAKLINANTLLDAGNPLNIKIKKAIAKGEG